MSHRLPGRMNAEIELEEARQGADTCAEPEVWTALRLWIALARAQTAIAAREQTELNRYGLTRAEFGVLDVLFFRGPQLVGEIQRRLLVSSGGITYLIDRLEERGFVERRPAPEDRRAVYAALSPEGEAYFRQIFPEHAQDLAVSVSALTQVEQVTLAGLLRRVGRHAAEMLREEKRRPKAE